MNAPSKMAASRLGCCICKDIFKNPKLISCHHSFCYECLDNYVRINLHNGRFNCPICRTSVGLPKGGVSGFQSNFYIDADSAEKFACDICGPKNVASNRCLDCEENLCQSCCYVHEKSKATRHHKIRDLLTVDSEMKGIIRQRVFCEQHPEEEIKLVCHDCGVPICIMCKAIQHENHATKSLADVAAEVKKSLDTKLNQCSDKLRRIKDSTAKGEELDRSISDAECQELKAVDDQCSQLHKAIDQEGAKMKEKIKHIYHLLRQQNSAFKRDMQDEFKACSSTKDNVQNIRDQGTYIEIIQKGPNVEQLISAAILKSDQSPNTRLDNKLFSPSTIDASNLIPLIGLMQDSTDADQGKKKTAPASPTAAITIQKIPEKQEKQVEVQELQNENDKLKREVTKCMKAIAESANSESKAGKTSKDIKEFMGQYDAMADELERRQEECIQLRTLLAVRSISSHAIAKEYYGGSDDGVNEDNELAMAYQTVRDLNGLLEKQLQKTEKELKRKESEYTKEINDLKKDNDRHQKIIEKSLNLGPDAKTEAIMQHEITWLTSENLDLRETIAKQNEQIQKLKKMLKVFAKRLNEGNAAEIQAEMEREEAKSMESVAQIIHRERYYLGMLKYKKEDEAGLIKNLITDLKPHVAICLLPGLPAYILFMCVRYTDYINDDEKVRSLFTASINGIKKAVKEHHKDLDRVTMWLANTCRLLNTMKQYSGEKAFQAENTSRQNEHCLQNFDLSEYRQVFNDMAIWIYQTLIRQMEATIQPIVVPAVLEHEAIKGLSGSKPSGMRGQSGSRHAELDHQEVSLESLMKTLNSYMRVLTQHAVDPELIKQIFRQVYYFLCACALNNLLLKKDMCNWSKGMQIRYNLSHLEQWLKDNELNESGAQAALEPIIQASQLLQARKTDADVESVCDKCSRLTVAQIVRILNLYTPVDEFEERVPITFIRKIQERLKGRPPSDNTILMDLKFSYSVTFPFNPSSIPLETIEVPESLHKGFLTRL